MGLEWCAAAADCAGGVVEFVGAGGCRAGLADTGVVVGFGAGCCIGLDMFQPVRQEGGALGGAAGCGGCVQPDCGAVPA